jgi:hypothetical protein
MVFFIVDKPIGIRRLEAPGTEGAAVCRAGRQMTIKREPACQKQHSNTKKVGWTAARTARVDCGRCRLGKRSYSGE